MLEEDETYKIIYLTALLMIAFIFCWLLVSVFNTEEVKVS